MTRSNIVPLLPTVQTDRSPTVRDRIVAVAARHFAEHGIQGASQRAIQREVGVNISTANYYFGSKESLYRAVIDEALSRILPARITGLAAIPKNLTRAAKTEALMRAYLAPHLREMKTENGYNYARILVSVHLVVPHVVADLVAERITPVREDYVDALSKLYPNVSRNRLYEVLRLGVGLMAVGPSWLGHEHMTEPEIEKLVSDVTQMATAGFEILCQHP